MGNLWNKLRQVREVQQAAAGEACLREACMAPLAPSAPRGCGEHGAPGPFEAGRQGRPDGGSSRDTESPLLEQRLIAARRAVAAAEAELAHRMAELELRRAELCDVVRQIETARRCDPGPGSKGGPVAGRLALHTP